MMRNGGSSARAGPAASTVAAAARRKPRREGGRLAVMAAVPLKAGAVRSRHAPRDVPGARHAERDGYGPHRHSLLVPGRRLREDAAEPVGDDPVLALLQHEDG